MCGIAGFCDMTVAYEGEKERWLPILEEMNRVQKHRGPDGEGTYLKDRCGLAHVRLKIIDLVTGEQPMVRRTAEGECAITYNGEIYNMPELKAELLAQGARFETESDTEVILLGYLRYGEAYIKRLNGIFAFALWDGRRQELLLCRDRLGVKPLFYIMKGNTLVFSSEIKGLFAYPGVEAAVDREGLCEIFALGPARTYGKGVFRGVREVLPGEYLRFGREGLKRAAYWRLESRPHEDSFEETVERVSGLVQDAVRKQMLSDIPVSTFLSGGIDSSLVTAVCARTLAGQGKTLNTFPLISGTTAGISRRTPSSRGRTDPGPPGWRRPFTPTTAFWSAITPPSMTACSGLWTPGTCRGWRTWSPPCCISALR